ncbi:MAG: hypothetical protein LBI10_04695 [Deltaproteobacteria bacterium]|jgi:hypothetical protein|nr:hypothetical protein [Deltaproteobacteria bacterium]
MSVIEFQSVNKIINKETGEVLITTETSKDVPYLDDFTKLGFREAFDQTESAVLEAIHESAIKAIQHRLNDGATKKGLEAQNEFNVEGNKVIESTYSIESTIGSITVATYRLVSNNKIIFDTNSNFYNTIGPCEKLYSSNVEESLLFAATRMSLRDTCYYVGKFSSGKTIISPTTLRNKVERNGLEIADKVSASANVALDAEDTKAVITSVIPAESANDLCRVIDPAIVENAAKKLGIKDYDSSAYEALNTVNISVDDVGVKAQKPFRPMPNDQLRGKWVNNTVAHIENKDGKYVFNGYGTDNVLRLVIAFMVINGIMLKQQLVFFSDGAKKIHEGIIKNFVFTKYKIILDYYDLQKKIKELFIMAFKGKDIRNDQYNAIMKILWVGDVSGSIAFVENADPSIVKNKSYLTQLIGYLNRVRDYIPNYALRKEIGLRNSSGIVEKSNDQVVAKRQKHNGMSWSKEGSLGLATVTCASLNGELDEWTKKRVIPFKPIPVLDVAA